MSMPDTLPILFIDIDGVMLRRRHLGMFDGFELAPHCLEFLEFATARFTCHGSHHGVGRDSSTDHGAHFVQPGHRSTIPVLNLIEPAAWSVNKTEAIDPISDFWWLDDDPTEDDRAWLRSHNRQDRLIEVGSDRDPDALLVARAALGAVQPRWISIASP
jgi:hypothetical protein